MLRSGPGEGAAPERFYMKRGDDVIDTIEEAVREDLESQWPDATLEDRRVNTGYDERGRTTSHTFLIRAGDRKLELVVGPDAERSGDADGVVRALREGEWTERLRAEGALLVERRDDGFELGARPDRLVL